MTWVRLGQSPETLESFRNRLLSSSQVPSLRELLAVDYSTVHISFSRSFSAKIAIAMALGIGHRRFDGIPSRSWPKRLICGQSRLGFGRKIPPQPPDRHLDKRKGQPIFRLDPKYL